METHDMKLDPESFLQVAEAALLTELGDKLKTHFSPKIVEYRKVSGERGGLLIGESDELYERLELDNPRSAIKPLAQVNMVANVSFHLLAQQLAVFFGARPEVNKEAVFDTTFDNIRRLTAYYVKLLKEEEQHEGHGERPGGGAAS